MQVQAAQYLTITAKQRKHENTAAATTSEKVTMPHAIIN